MRTERFDPDQIDEAIRRGSTGEGAHTEDELALDFVERHGLNLRYVAAWGQWLEWTGANWEPEKTLKTYDLARKICRKAASECDRSAEKKMLSKGKTVAAVEQLARSDRRVASVIGQWDSNHLLFNTPSGDNDNER
jgi:putative DNA primase/helicase